MTRQSVPQSRCIGRKGSVTKGNTPSPWLNKICTIRARWSELPTSSYLKHICDIRWSLFMKSFVHKSKYFVINALFDGKPVKFIDEFCNNGIKLAFFEDQSSRCYNAIDCLDWRQKSQPSTKRNCFYLFGWRGPWNRWRHFVMTLCRVSLPALKPTRSCCHIGLRAAPNFW